MVTDPQDTTDLVVIGAGFGSLFLVKARARGFPGATITVIERGHCHDRDWRIEHNRYSTFRVNRMHTTRRGEKVWNDTIGFGGGLNGWSGQTPRFHPSDFQTKTLHGRGIDWPVTYDQPEPFRGKAEDRRGIAGDRAMASVPPRSGGAGSFPSCMARCRTR